VRFVRATVAFAAAERRYVCFRLRNDPYNYCAGWGVKLYSLTDPRYVRRQTSAAVLSAKVVAAMLEVYYVAAV